MRAANGPGSEGEQSIRASRLPRQSVGRDGAAGAAGPDASDPVMGGRGTLRQRLATRCLAAVISIACRLPEGIFWRLADPAGGLAYHLATRRRDRAKRNLRRVVEWMAEHGAGAETYRRAATDERTLDRLVKAAFRQHARYYLEFARSTRLDATFMRERLLVETPESLTAAFEPSRPIILVGMHFGAIELPGFLAAYYAGTATAPMETLANPALQRYVATTRARIGVHIVGLDRAASELAAALRRGEPVGLIADRDLTGSGVTAELFGAPAPIPPGPALLALESKAPMFVAAVRRAGPGRYRGNIRPLATPTEGSIRERVRQIVQAEARLFEQAIVDAPEQWWAIFFPIWPDLEEAHPDGAARAAA